MSAPKPSYEELQHENQKLKEQLAVYKTVKSKLTPTGSFSFHDVFDVNEIQHLQDLFAESTGVASMITAPDGTPITKSSNFCNLCNMIRRSEIGRRNCKYSDSIIGKQNTEGPICQPCLSAGLLDAGASITVAGKHIGNWLIGQVKTPDTDEEKILAYAHEIGADEAAFKKAIEEVPVMSENHFKNIANTLFFFANELANRAFQNLQQQQLITDISEKEKQLIEKNRKLWEIKNLMMHITNNMVDMLSITDKEGYFIYVSPSHSYLGYNPDELLGKKAFPYVHSEDLNRVSEAFQSLLQNKTSKKVECRYRCADNSFMWLEIIGKVINDNELLFSSRNITERKKQQEELEKANRKYLLIAENTSDGIFIANHERKIVYASPAYHKMLGYAQGEVVNKGPDEIYSNIHEEDRDEVFKEIYAAIEQQKEEVTYLFRAKHKKGHYIWREDHARFFYDKEGNFKESYVICRDITERKKAEEELLHQRKLFETMFNTIQEAVVITDTQRKILLANKGVYTTFGYRPEEVIGHETKILYEDEQKFSKAGQTVFNQEANDQTIQYLSRYKKKNKKVFSGETFGSKLFNENGAWIGNIGIMRDVSEREEYIEDLKKAKKQAEEQRKEIELNNQRLDSLLQINQFKTNSKQELLDFALIKAIELTNSKIGYIYFYNEKTRMFTLNTWSDGVMKECDVVEPQTVYALDKTGCWGEAVRQKKPIVINNYDAPNPHKKGTPKGHIKLKKFLTIPVIIDDKIVAVTGVANKPQDYNDSDITQLSLLMGSVWKTVERVDLINDLNTAKEKAEESNRLKTEFLNNMSHEIRTPMNGIVGFAEMLNKPDLPDNKRKNFIQIIKNSSNQLVRIIDDILEISTLETKQLKINEEPFCLNDLLTELYSIFDLKSQQRFIPIYVKKGLSDSDSTIITDRSKLNKILSNLLENAIKFTNEGFIELGYFLKDNQLNIYVKDTGIGVSKTNSEIIFERFSQEEKKLSKKYGGLGLGLSISKENAQLLGGHISLESEKGEGATFTLTLPYRAVQGIKPADNEPEEQLKAKKSYHVLIVEDEEMNYLYLEALLEDAKTEEFILFHAKNGKEAVQFIESNKSIDIVLMDLKLPEMNGYAATQEIKALRPNLPVIAQTAYSTLTDKQKAFNAGCNGFLTKPINSEQLFNTLKSFLMD